MGLTFSKSLKVPATRIELALSAWQADVIPFYYAGARGFLIIFGGPKPRCNLTFVSFTASLDPWGRESSIVKVPTANIRTLVTAFILYRIPSTNKAWAEAHSFNARNSTQTQKHHIYP